MKRLQNIIGIALIASCFIIFPARGQEADQTTSVDLASRIAEGKAQMSQAPEEALKIFETVLAQTPDNAEVLYYAANLSLQLNQTRQGLNYMKRSVELTPGNTRLQLILAQAYERTGFTDDALREYQKVITLAPDSTEASEATQRIQILSNNKVVTESSSELPALIAKAKDLMPKDPEAALQLFKTILEQTPDNAEVLYYAANLSLQLNQTRQGLDYMKRSVELTPDNMRLLLILAQAYERTGFADDALREYQKVITLAPDSTEANEATQRIQILSGNKDSSGIPQGLAAQIAEAKNRSAQDPEGALQIFETVLEQEPDNAEVLYYAANLALQLNRTEQGLAYMKRSAELTPDNMRLLLILAQAYERAGFADDALREYHQVIALAAPDSTETKEATLRTQIIPGKQALAQGEIEKASRYFSDILINTSNDTAVLTEILTIYSSANQMESLQNLLESLIAIQPDNRSIHTALANIYDRTNDQAKAIEHYERLLELLPSDASPQARQDIVQRLNTLKGFLALQNNDYEAAKEHLENFLSIEPDNLGARLNLVTTYISLDDKTTAEKLLLDVIHDHPDNLNVRLRLGELYINMERWRDAARTLEDVRIIGRNQQEGQHAGQLLNTVYASEGGEELRDVIQGEIIQGFINQLEQQPDESDTLSKLGFIYLIRQEFEKARDVYQNMYRFDPANVQTGIMLASLFDKLEDHDEAEKILLGIIDAHPDSAQLIVQLGSHYIDRERMTDAARQLEKAKILGRGTPFANQAAELLAKVYATDSGEAIQQQVRDEILQPLQEQAEETPDSYEAWSELGSALLAFNRLEEGTEAYENLVRIKPDDTQAYGTLAGLYDNANKFDKAEAAYIKTDELVQNPDIKKNIAEKLTLVQGKMALNNNDLELAETKFKELVTYNPENFIPHFYLGSIYSSQGKYDEAVNAYQEVIRISPGNINAHLTLGGLYAQLKRDEDALDEYKSILTMSPSETAREETEQRIIAIKKRIHGFSYTLNYSTGYQSNLNLTKEDPRSEVIHSMGAGVTYRRKIDHKPVYWGATLNASYIIYENLQLDFLQTSVSPYASFTLWGLDYSTSVNVGQMEDFLHETESSKSSGFNGDVSDSFRMYALIPWLATDALRKAAPSTWRVNLAVRESENISSSINDAINYSLAGSINQSIGNGWSMNTRYTYTVNDNTDDLGNDLAYTGHGISLQITKGLKPGLSINGGYSLTKRNYTNNDSATLFTIKRTNFNQVYSGGLNYFLNNKLRLFINASYTINESDLPTGFVFNPTGTAVAFQSNSIGDYINYSFTAGLALSL